jgi:uncharacterized protein YbjT (DUF2867 family)
VARALIVGCGCRGRDLGTALLGRGWQVRGTSREPGGVTAIEAAGIEGALGDPDRIGTLTEHVEDVSLVYWLLGSAVGEPENLAAIHGPRLERMLEEIVDTPVRAFVYELNGGIESEHALGAFEILRAARERWRIPFEVVDADPAELGIWREGMVSAAESLIGG